MSEDSLRTQLAAAQAEIKEHNERWQGYCLSGVAQVCNIKGGTAALDAAIAAATAEIQRTGCAGTEYTHIRNIAAATKPLVDALENLVAECKRQDIKLGSAIGDAEAALAQVKEGK